MASAASDVNGLTSDEVSDVIDLLTADALSALMRSTWTWDDRALRRDLSTVLVDLDAAKLVGEALGTGSAVARRLHAAALEDASRFVAAVLGPKLIADTGNPLREQYLTLATDPVRYARLADQAHSAIAGEADAYFRSHVDKVEYPSPSSWTQLVAEKGAAGLGQALRSHGHLRNDSALFGSKALAWQAVEAVPNCDVATDYAQRLRSGDLSGALAAAEDTGSWDPALVRTAAAQNAEKWQLTGSKNYVPAADAADVIFVIARSVAGPSLFAVETTSSGVSVEPHSVVDDTRPLFRVILTDAPATLVGQEGAGGRLMSQVLDRATTALAAEQVGVIEAAIEFVRNGATVSDDRTAELVLDHAAAHALWQRALAEGSPEAAAEAHIGCSAAAVRVTSAVAELRETEETTALFKRALSGSLLFGGPALAHERLLDRLGI
ncbi:MAG TPA: acyl-CoA dehydrogenase family protein [Mycobacterium sp.]|jgi:alkylation response protein AidB-like acyl-CoA dehydrogenase|nr:acyl-CoA dehydrogenase family protein [Mycobacterium sp.]